MGWDGLGKPSAVISIAHSIPMSSAMFGGATTFAERAIVGRRPQIRVVYRKPFRHADRPWIVDPTRIIGRVAAKACVWRHEALGCRLTGRTGVASRTGRLPPTGGVTLI
jgi:hypothetical protein